MTTPTPETTAQPTLEQMRVEVLEWMGWDFDPIEAQGWKSQQDNHCWCKNPDTCELVIKFGTGFPALTLDWLHEAWLILSSREQRFAYSAALDKVVRYKGISSTDEDIKCLRENATAPQRLIAIWRTIKNV